MRVLDAKLAWRCGGRCPGLAAVLMALALGTGAWAGCQSFAPADITGLAVSKEERQILKLAHADPFPSPADVGLEEPTSTP